MQREIGTPTADGDSFREIGTPTAAGGDSNGGLEWDTHRRRIPGWWHRDEELGDTHAAAVVVIGASAAKCWTVRRGLEWDTHHPGDGATVVD